MANILVVDDDPLAVEMLRDLLVDQDHSVFAAENFTSMHALLFARPYALVIMDYNLPGLKGDALTRIIARSLDPKPKVLLHSSIAEAELRRLARRVGALGYLAKGCSEADMLATIDAALARYSQELGSLTSSPGAGSVAPRPSLTPIPTSPPTISSISGISHGPPVSSPGKTDPSGEDPGDAGPGSVSPKPKLKI